MTAPQPKPGSGKPRTCAPLRAAELSAGRPTSRAGAAAQPATGAVGHQATASQSVPAQGCLFSEAHLACIRAECEWLSGPASWRRRRRASLALFRELAPALGESSAAALAEAITGVEPKLWLSVSEAARELRELGVRKSTRSLHRLAKKARLTHDGWLRVWIDRRGNWDSPNSPDMANPRACLTVQWGAHVRFLVEAVSQNSPNRDT